MLLIANGRFKTEVLGALAAAGYRNTMVAVVTASDYGVPQARKRAIFFGIRNDLDLGMDIGDFFAKALEAERQPSPTVEEALWDLPEEVSPDDGPLPYPPYPRTRLNRRPAAEFRLDREGLWYPKEYKLAAAQGVKLLYNHHTKGIQQRRRNLIAELKPGANGRTLQPETWQGLRAEKWRRLDPRKPSHTILAQMHRDMSEWVHPWCERWITVREAARLQSFHDGFVFKTSEWQMLKQVGNAVPPLMARALASVAQTALDRIGGSEGA
jgi:DNA (cytosine-5)-methyltransferase 1